jgi:hypothetical protein
MVLSFEDCCCTGAAKVCGRQSERYRRQADFGFASGARIGLSIKMPLTGLLI